jgi:hypothetical protein
MKPRPRTAVAAAVSAALLTGCGSVNEDAGQPVDRSYAMLQYADGAAPPPAPPGRDSLYGTYQMQVSGSLGYLGKTVRLATTGAMTLAPGPRSDELRIAYYSGRLRFPYETQSVTVSGDTSSLNAVTLVNPLDSRVSLECAVDGGMSGMVHGPMTEAHEVTGTCTGGAEVRGTMRPDGGRKARWRGRPVELVRMVLDLDVSGSSSGTVHMVTETPTGSTFPLTTTMDVDVTAQGITLTQRLERHVLPRVQG